MDTEVKNEHEGLEGGHDASQHDEQQRDSSEQNVASAKKKKNIDSIRVSKKTLIAIGIVAVLLLCALYGRTLIFAATVNGTPITRWEVMHGLEQSSGKAYVETLITEKLITGDARKHGIRISNADIAKEIAHIEEGLAAQGATLDMLLSSQGMTREGLNKQISLKLMLEQLLADKLVVTDAEIDSYITQAKITVPEDKKVEMRAGIAEQLKGEKLNKEAGAYIDGLRTAAHTSYFGLYAPAISAK